jgi:hypothetical protein
VALPAAVTAMNAQHRIGRSFVLVMALSRSSRGASPGSVAQAVEPARQSLL